MNEKENKTRRKGIIIDHVIEQKRREIGTCPPLNRLLSLLIIHMQRKKAKARQVLQKFANNPARKWRQLLRIVLKRFKDLYNIFISPPPYSPEVNIDFETFQTNV